MSTVEIGAPRETAAERQQKLAAALPIVALIIFGLAGVSPKVLGEIAAGFLCLGPLLARAAAVRAPEPSLLRASSQDMRGRRQW